MPKIAYQAKKFRKPTLTLIATARKIIEEYEALGFSLTLRQLYYQFVARDLIDNTQKEYKRLGDIINNARLAGLIDWYSIEDRTRNLRGMSTWENIPDIVGDLGAAYKMDLWEDQPEYVEVWIEKDALIGVIEDVCQTHRVDYFSCRGYISQSEMWKASQRMIMESAREKNCNLIHLGDHDPSGIDMTRDIQDRFSMFGARVNVIRAALNMDQVDEHSPPPNPAKITDSRFENYMVEYGPDSWELDALNPTLISQIIEDHVSGLIQWDLWEVRDKMENKDKGLLVKLRQQWPAVQKLLNKKNKK